MSLVLEKLCKKVKTGKKVCNLLEFCFLYSIDITI